MVNLAFAVLLLIMMQGIVTGNGTKSKEDSKASLGTIMLREFAAAMGESMYEMFVPCIAFAEEGGYGSCWLFQEQMEGLLPLYKYVVRDLRWGDADDKASFREILLAEAEEGVSEENAEDAGSTRGDIPKQPFGGEEYSMEELLKAENEAAIQIREEPTVFVPHGVQAQLDLAVLRDYETLLTRFYTVDSNTMIGSDQLNADSFLEKDMRVSKDSGGPQILIFHTHSQEGFADSVPGDSATSIVGVGERLAGILTDTYGYEVLHHTEAYNAEGRDDAYSRALPGIEQVLRENPSIQVIIDLHRDEMPEETRLVMDLDGRPTARFMFFNGLSRTKKTGNIAYLYNENLDENLAFSFQMQVKAAEYYPGLTRKIYLKGYRYNMHLRDKYLLVELGAQNNTVEEAMNACDPLAHILDMVLGGES